MKIKLVLLTLIICAFALSQAPLFMLPDPKPEPKSEVDLSGCFIGPDAAKDAAIVACLCDELAACIDYDSKQENPVLTTGVALDELRVRARSLRCHGESLSQKHPQLGKRVGDYLDKQIGNAGGPINRQQVQRWVHAYKEIAKAATSAIR